MKIIIRTCGERTTKECIRLASRQGQVEIIEARPFAESIKKTYLLAMTFEQKWIPVIDADVLLNDGVIEKAILELEKKADNIFCLDGKTKDKIMMRNRRAGIHIYRCELLNKAIKYIDHKQIKPESHIRRMMGREGYPTYVSKIIFGKHDYEQYYCDLWRKSVCQTRKLAGVIRRKKKLLIKWRQFGKQDLDYFVIFQAHHYGKKLRNKMIIDKRIDFNAARQLKKLRIIEKKPLK